MQAWTISCPWILTWPTCRRPKNPASCSKGNCYCKGPNSLSWGQQNLTCLFIALTSVLNKGILQVVTYTEEMICLFLLIDAKTEKCKSFPCALPISSEDHWLGLKKIYFLTKNKTNKWTMRVDLWDHDSGNAFAEYKHFSIGNEKTAFKLHVGKYRGNAGTAGFSNGSFLAFLHCPFFPFAFNRHTNVIPCISPSFMLDCCFYQIPL